MPTKSTTKAKPRAKTTPPKRTTPRRGGAGEAATAQPPSTLESGAKKNSALSIEGWTPFRGTGLRKGTREVIDRILHLKMLATHDFLRDTPELRSTREFASRMLAELAGHFIKHWPHDPRCVQPEIWALHEDTESGFRQRWDTKGKEPGKKRAGMPVVPMADDFAGCLLMRLDSDDVVVKAENMADLWREHFESQGQAMWDRFSSANLHKYYGSASRLELGWTKGRWREKVKRSFFKRVRDAELA